MAAQITQAEINQLKSQFDKKLGKFSVIFDKDENGEENFKIYNGKSGADAYWSGKIILQNDYSISWKFSLLDGLTLSSEAFKVDENTKDIVLYIKDMYDIWYQNISPYIVNLSPTLPRISIIFIESFSSIKIFVKTGSPCITPILPLLLNS
jgi:hypothetical protein